MRQCVANCQCEIFSLDACAVGIRLSVLRKVETKINDALHRLQFADLMPAPATDERSM